MNIFNEPQARADDMLIAALPEMLKQSAAERSEFAQKVIDQAEVVFTQYVKNMEEKLANVSDEEARRDALVDNAREKLSVAKTERATGAEQVSASELELLQAKNALANAEKERDQLQHKFQEHKQSLDNSQASLASFVTSCTEFEKLKDFSCSTAAGTAISENLAEAGVVADSRIEMSASSSSLAGFPEPLTPEKEPKPSHLRRPTIEGFVEDIEKDCLEA